MNRWKIVEPICEEIPAEFQDQPLEKSPMEPLVEFLKDFLKSRKIYIGHFLTFQGMKNSPMWFFCEEKVYNYSRFLHSRGCKNMQYAQSKCNICEYENISKNHVGNDHKGIWESVKQNKRRNKRTKTKN